MADESDPSLAAPSGQQTTEPTAGAGAEQESPTVPVAALRAEREKRQALEKQLAEFTAQQEAARQKAAEEAGQFRELYESAKPRLERLEALEAAEAARAAALTERNAERLTLLPNHLRDLVPEGLEGDALAAHLDRVEKLAPQVTGGPTGSRMPGAAGLAEALTAEERAFAVERRLPADLAPAVVKKLYTKHKQANSRTTT